MTLQSFIRGFLSILCRKIMNSVVVVGFYYGFLTTLAIVPSYLFIIRARVMEKGTETQVAATTGFLTGQLMMFISIYYAPLHLALSRPHTIIVLTLPYFILNFFAKNDKQYYLDSRYQLVDYGYQLDSLDSGYQLDSGYKNQNSIRNFSIYKVFFNHFVFQVLNPLLFPSSILIRLVHIYLFRCNNKLLFITSSFVGWLIGQIFLMKSIELILIWFQQKNSIKSKVTNLIKSKVTIRFDKYILLQFRDYGGQIFVVFSFMILLHYLGRIPLPYYFIDEMLESQEIDVEKDLETEETQEEQKGSIEKDLSPYLFSESEKNDIVDKIKDDKELLIFQKPIVSVLFDFQRWYRPLRYIKNDHFENAVRNENSQFFFHICQSDGKERISFTYPPDLSTFLKMMKKKMDLLTRDKISDNELSNYWSSNHKEKRKRLSNEFLKRAKVLDKGFLPQDVFENRVRLCKDENQKKYLPKIYDPFLNGRFRGQIQKNISPETYTTNSILINKIHGILLSMNSHYPEFEQKMDPFDRKSLGTEIGFFVNLISKFSEKSVSSLNFDRLYLFPEHEQVKIYSEEKKRKKKFLLDAIRTDLNDQTIFNRKKCIGINEISKKLPRWSYKLIDELEQLVDNSPKEAQIRFRKADRIVIFNSETEKYSEDINTMNISNTDDNKDGHPSNIDTMEPNKELILLNYSREPDFIREIIKGSPRPQRRKTLTWKLLQRHAKSPIFLDTVKENLLFDKLFRDISQYVKEYFRKEGTDNSEFLAYLERAEEELIEEEKNEAENRLREIEDAWESVLYGLIIRNFVILFQSYFRKYIILPSLIITKNIIRTLLLQNPEWMEDYRDWQKEVHIRCTYQGIPVSHKEFPKNWVTEGLQIRILCPFVLKPWHKKKRSTEKKKRSIENEKKREDKNLWFLTASGTLVESYLDYYVPNPFSFLGPIFKKIRKQLKKDLIRTFFLGIELFKDWGQGFLEDKDVKAFIKLIKFLYRFLKKSELSESEKNSTISKNNPMIDESPVRIQSSNWTNWALTELTEKNIKDLHLKTWIIRKEIERVTQEEKGGVITSEINLNSNKTTEDAKRLELKNNIWQILQRRTVRLTRKSYSFFKLFMEGVYSEILLSILTITRTKVEQFFNLTILITNQYKKYIDNKKKNAKRIKKTNPSQIPSLSLIDKSWNIPNSENSWDVSSLVQDYVFLKLSQIPVSNVYNYKLRSIFESPGRSFFLKNEIKNDLQQIVNSKLRHKNLSNSVMNQWTNWLKVHYQYDLPQSGWSGLVSQNWRNRVNEHRVAQNKDLIEYDSDEYDSDEKTRLILPKKEQVDLDLLELKKKIKKQYRYDRMCYQYLNYAAKQKSNIYGYRSPFQANKNQAISYNDNTRKKEFLDITDDISIKNYIAEDVIIDMEKKLDRKYFDWGIMDLERLNHSRSNPKFNHSISNRFFFNLWRLYDAYQKNPWSIRPIQPLLVNFHGNELSETTKISGKTKRLEIVSPSVECELDTQNRGKAKYKGSENGDKSIDPNLYRKDFRGEQDFLLEKFLGFHLNFHISLQERIMNNVQTYCLLLRLNNIKDYFILSVKKGEISLDAMAIQTYTDYPLIGFKDTDEMVEKQIFSLEPVRLARKNYEQFFIYQTVSLSLKNKRKIFQMNKHKNNYDLLLPENLLSTRCRRELRILLCFNRRNTVHRNTINYNETKINSQVLAKNKDLDIEKKKLMNFKSFLWPNYRLEDLACINRYWFDTHNGSRFSTLRIRMYPRLKSR